MLNREWCSGLRDFLTKQEQTQNRFQLFHSCENEVPTRNLKVGERCPEYIRNYIHPEAPYSRDSLEGEDVVLPLGQLLRDILFTPPPNELLSELHSKCDGLSKELDLIAFFLLDADVDVLAIVRQLCYPQDYLQHYGPKIDVLLALCDMTVKGFLLLFTEALENGFATQESTPTVYSKRKAKNNANISAKELWNQWVLGDKVRFPLPMQQFDPQAIDVLAASYWAFHVQAWIEDEHKNEGDHLVLVKTVGKAMESWGAINILYSSLTSSPFLEGHHGVDCVVKTSRPGDVGLFCVNLMHSSRVDEEKTKNVVRAWDLTPLGVVREISLALDFLDRRSHHMYSSPYMRCVSTIMMCWPEVDIPRVFDILLGSFYPQSLKDPSRPDAIRELACLWSLDGITLLPQHLSKMRSCLPPYLPHISQLPADRRSSKAASSDAKQSDHLYPAFLSDRDLWNTLYGSVFGGPLFDLLTDNESLGVEADRVIIDQINIRDVSVNIKLRKDEQTNYNSALKLFIGECPDAMLDHALEAFEDNMKLFNIDSIASVACIHDECGAVLSRWNIRSPLIKLQLERDRDGGCVFSSKLLEICHQMEDQFSGLPKELENILPSIFMSPLLSLAKSNQVVRNFITTPSLLHIERALDPILYQRILPSCFSYFKAAIDLYKHSSCCAIDESLLDDELLKRRDRVMVCQRMLSTPNHHLPFLSLGDDNFHRLIAPSDFTGVSRVLSQKLPEYGNGMMETNVYPSLIVAQDGVNVNRFPTSPAVDHSLPASVTAILFSKRPQELGLDCCALVSVCPQSSSLSTLGPSHSALLQPSPGVSLIYPSVKGKRFEYQSLSGRTGPLAVLNSWNYQSLPRKDIDCSIWDEAKGKRIYGTIGDFATQIGMRNTFRHPIESPFHHTSIDLDRNK
eukprot:GHVH01007296.1.p1 GENE.GHVH01007296.1~~GHVH01007296.1.p1  ORF type:complete len:907 (+),score=107.31 GHVH01007296.1:26-2746(+)